MPRLGCLLYTDPPDLTVACSISQVPWLLHPGLFGSTGVHKIQLGVFIYKRTVDQAI